jgi:hypothetical protein
MKSQLSTEVPSKLKEQRRYLRYAVSGSFALDYDGKQCSGVPLNISIGGIFFQADVKVPVGTVGTIRLAVFNFRDAIVCKVRVVRSVGTSAAAVFIDPPVELTRLIALLAG